MQGRRVRHAWSLVTIHPTSRAATVERVIASILISEGLVLWDETIEMAASAARWQMLAGEVKKQASGFLQDKYKQARLALGDVTPAEL